MAEPKPGTSMTNVEREQHLQGAQKKAADAAKAEEIKDSDFRAILRRIDPSGISFSYVLEYRNTL